MDGLGTDYTTWVGDEFDKPFSSCTSVFATADPSDYGTISSFLGFCSSISSSIEDYTPVITTSPVIITPVISTSTRTSSSTTNTHSPVPNPNAAASIYAFTPWAGLLITNIMVLYL